MPDSCMRVVAMDLTSRYLGVRILARCFCWKSVWEGPIKKRMGATNVGVRRAIHIRGHCPHPATT